MPRAVLFDVDGTLIDTVDFHAKAWQVVLAKHGHDVPFEDVRKQIGKGGDQLMPVFLPKEQIEREGKQIEAERLAYFKKEFLSKVRPFPDVRPLFERLRADGKRVALASSAKEEELKNYIKIADIEGLVDQATTSDDADRSKPHPDIFHATLARLKDVEPSEAIVVGDTPYDAEAAGKAGLRTIGLLCGGFPEGDLRAAGCIALYRDPADLLAHYDRSPLALP
jgi:HAD superfamily hydrolase (TIGR01509 family)